MKAPLFWWQPEQTPAASILKPIGALYGAITALRMGRTGTRLPVPVICVGNLVAGGAGKTPVALALGRMLVASGRRPAFLSRGYGAAAGRRAVLLVDPARHTARESGDEPLLLAAVAPTYVCTDRVAAGRQAVAGGADVLIMDDGLQNPALVKDLAIAVVDAGVGSGNGLCVPAGPLRAPVARQLPFVSALCVVGEGARGMALEVAAVAAHVPVLHASLKADADTLARLRGRRILAFAGIGRPEKFFATLTEAGMAVTAIRAFPDHHPFAAPDLARLKRDADRDGAMLVTTSKDKTRLPRDYPVETLAVTLAFDDPPAMHRLLEGLQRHS